MEINWKSLHSETFPRLPHTWATPLLLYRYSQSQDWEQFGAADGNKQLKHWFPTAHLASVSDSRPCANVTDPGPILVILQSHLCPVLLICILDREESLNEK